MDCEIRYGDGAKLQLDLPPAAVLADCTRPHGAVLPDPAAAVQAATTNPLGFPPLRAAVVPGDHVAISLDSDLPQKDQLVTGIVRSLLEGTPEIGSIRVVLSAGSLSVLSGLPDSVQASIEMSVHDPSDPSKLSYLAASKEGKPIYFNKTICDADVVLPVSTLRLEQALGYHGIHSGLFPAFSDEVTLQRFRAPGTRDWTAHQRRRREEVEEAAWLLGVQLTIQVTPGPGDSILHVLAGEGQQVAQRGQKLCRAAWMHAAPSRAELVVAGIEGGPEQQTWDNFARALFAASQAVDEGGAILLCTQLRCPPGPALMRLTDGVDEEQTLHAIRRDRSTDAVSASLLAEAKQRARVYLLSDLNADFVEDLGIGHVRSSDDAGRLSSRYNTCILLGSAQHALVGDASNWDTP